jgi:hypothetical protein
MSRISRLGRSTVVAALAVAVVGSPALTAVAQASSVDKPGLVGGHVLLQDHASYSGFDAGTDAAGNTYIGWIGSVYSLGSAGRTAYLCMLPPGAQACQGGIQHTVPINPSTASGLRLLVTPAGLVTMVWSESAPVPDSSGRNGRVVVATSQSGGPLGAATVVADAPNETSLLDAEFGPGGALWTVMAIGAGTSSLEVREGVSNPPTTVALPWSPGPAYLAFNGSTPVLAVQENARLSVPPAYSFGPGFTSWKNVPDSWTAGANIGLAATRSGIRMVASNLASNAAAISKLSGGTFTKPVLEGVPDNCVPSSHDLGADASGRLVDVSNECGTIAVDNFPTTTLAGEFRFTPSGTLSAGPPQITTTPRGRGVVVWGVESPGSGAGDSLYFNRILLAGRDTSARKSGVRVTGPTSCQPASTIAVSVTGSRAGWKVSSASLTFGGKKLAPKTTIDGAKLVGGKLYSLVGKVVFSKGGVHSTGTETLKFRSCINP